MAPPPYPPPIKPEDFIDTIDEAWAGEPPLARVARTAASLGEKHHNTLVPPSHGVVWIQLSAGAAKSKSFGGVEEKDGAEDFHYAPGVEDLTLKYKIHDPKRGVLAARLELFGRFSATPLWQRDLTEDERTDGEHSLTFDMGAGPNARFPDMLPTAEHSPYKLRLSTSSTTRPQSPAAWTYFQVLVHDITLELGDKKVLPADLGPSGGAKRGSHRDLYDSLGGNLPAEGNKTKLELLGNLFKTGTAEMYSNVAFDTHRTQWGDGPQIPIYAKLRVRKSDDTGVDAPLALGEVRCLWDWEDVAEDTSALNPEPSLFVGRSVNYDRLVSKPAGDNCHKTRGGKRTNDGASDPVFPAQAGYAPKPALDNAVFPFHVEAAPTRKWSALSKPWRTGNLAGRTGAMFSPSRMAGDVFTVRCYVAWEKDKDGKLVLDIEDAIKDKTSLLASTGSFELWRKHLINRYIKKKNFAMSIPVGKVQDYYKKAFVNMSSEYGAVEFMAAAAYNNAISNQTNAMAWYAKPAVDPTVNQYNRGDHCVTFRSYSRYKSALRSAKGWSRSQLNAWFAAGGAPLANATGYEKFCDSWGMKYLEAVANAYLPASDGVTLCQFVGVHNIGGGGGLNGYAADLAGATRQKAAFITCATPNAYSGNSNRLEQTTTHEIGHHLFMPHAVDGIPGGAGPAPTMHDKDDHHCTMTYNYSAERRWCGFCILRLRGWDKTPLDQDGTKNTHP